MVSEALVFFHTIDGTGPDSFQLQTFHLYTADPLFAYEGPHDYSKSHSRSHIDAPPSIYGIFRWTFRCIRQYIFLLSCLYLFHHEYFLFPGPPQFAHKYGSLLLLLHIAFCLQGYSIR